MIAVGELTDYLHLHIPLSKAMGVTALEASPSEVRLQALFEPNINHQATVFGGSASAVAILAAWSLMHVRLREAGLNCELVIQRNSMEYLLPFAQDFEAVSSYSDEVAWQRFLKLYQRRGRARLVVQARLLCDGKVVGELEGAFVALEREQ